MNCDVVTEWVDDDQLVCMMIIVHLLCLYYDDEHELHHDIHHDDLFSQHDHDEVHDDERDELGLNENEMHDEIMHEVIQEVIDDEICDDDDDEHDDHDVMLMYVKYHGLYSHEHVHEHDDHENVIVSFEHVCDLPHDDDDELL